MEETELLQTTDAMVWAKEFCERFNIYQEPGGVIEDGPGLMVGWFANAMAAQEMATRKELEA